MIAQAQIKEIYGRLQDELSLKIFENSLLYSLTDNIKHIVEMVYGSEDKWNFLYGYHNVIIYGVGEMAKYYSKYYDTINITAFCDKDDNKQKKLFCGYKVISPEELTKKYSDHVIAITLKDDKLITEVTKYLLKSGFSENQIFALKKDFGKQYFDIDILGCPNPNYEIFIDAGCFDGASSIDFIKWCSDSYKKIIAFEPDSKQHPICIENLKDMRNTVIHPYGLWNENTELSFDNVTGMPGSACISDSSENTIKIKTVKLDDIVLGDDITFIKMDVEGAELNALKGAEQTILKYRPKLAICVYHKPEDIWEIPTYILSLHKSYKLYLRRYGCNGTETVLYAV